jgi:hypothetical protein
MSTKPEALMLAEVLMHLPAADAKGHAYQSKAAAELRRLHSVNADLLASLQAVTTAVDAVAYGAALHQSRAAIDKAAGVA